MRQILFLTLFCLIAWIPGFFTLPPSDRDESRFAQASRQMIETGDYVTIMNGTEPRNRKPIGIYWLQVPFAKAAQQAGLAQENLIWPYRLPSLLGGLLAVWMTYGFGIRLVGRKGAFLGAWILGASVILLVETHMAKTDAALLAATLAAQGLLGRAYLVARQGDQDTRFGSVQAALFWIAMAAGILIKGPITPMVSALTVLTLLITDRRIPGQTGWLAALRWRWGLPLAVALILPWFIAIGIASHGQFFAQAIGGELASKVRSGDDSHGAPPGLHLLLLIITLFPGSLVVLQALPASWHRRSEPVMRFLLAWIIPSWIVFEAVPTKLPHYILPMLPALALLGGKAIAETLAVPRWMQWLAKILFVLSCLLLGGAAIALPFVIMPGLHWQDLLGIPAFLTMVMLLALGTGLLPRRQRDATPYRNIRLLLICAPLVGWSMLGLELPSLRTLWLSPAITRAARIETAELYGAHAPLDLVTAGYNEPSLRFLAGTDTFFAPDAASAAAWLAKHKQAIAAIARPDGNAFLAAATAQGLSPDLRYSMAGYNYSRGKRILIDLYASGTGSASTQ
ncbi:Undecaprenyl-phosphate-4-amino-L-arabinose--lipid A 4-amino-L-arabinosyltransferase [Granulibacter bethesdensis]|uniref:Undecaprenyl-phosphate-4-amino-L-arabinose--lipid A 4-amino-L-arabinosyltransferase n=1 Tax=Granulibacter bethesdensis TaxID=364410 RepID=A0AAN0VG92_9PROT|nr:glycosyltransferase family 39 protein [Granulibacter bethesdensis]AHJ63656.1 Undecaprenyl-phosphate-4-amino-L-arabinose--lipid A 4-amino-L-arabinosyltransferase [Granulibacter bethesdensis]